MENHLKKLFFLLTVTLITIGCILGAVQAQPTSIAQPPVKQDKYIAGLTNTLVLPTAKEVGKKLLTGAVVFVVELDGSLSEIKFTDSIGYGIDEQIINQLKNSKNWTPAMIDGSPMRVSYKLPLRIVLPKRESGVRKPGRLQPRTTI
ncbi:hypothetical protein SAMN05421747_1251 [Parapedobacter composti]|uniref:TonB protein C-terminal n=1 Tax=Parapedobacter composti TaxID=623281 RepID=A0A1I1LWV8_9SPHI|nr:hypothetical protein [Parapedobacter composti]SFC77581.1 hypothetical protein SAMN05421747_1251 [Parapedobacter composti]